MNEQERLENWVGISIGIRAVFKHRRSVDGSKYAATRLVRHAWEAHRNIKALHAHADGEFIGVVMEEFRRLSMTIRAMESAIGVPDDVLDTWRDVYCGVK